VYQRFARLLTAAALMVFALVPPACGGDDDDNSSGAENSCFVQCSGGLASCMSSPGLTQAECTATAEDDCGGAPMQVVVQTGCGCPGFDEPGECTSPPDWYQ
jgi:hypothetical protein